LRQEKSKAGGPHGAHRARRGARARSWCPSCPARVARGRPLERRPRRAERPAAGSRRPDTCGGLRMSPLCLISRRRHARISSALPGGRRRRRLAPRAWGGGGVQRGPETPARTFESPCFCMLFGGPENVGNRRPLRPPAPPRSPRSLLPVALVFLSLPTCRVTAYNSSLHLQEIRATLWYSAPACEARLCWCQRRQGAPLESVYSLARLIVGSSSPAESASLLHLQEAQLEPRSGCV